jgi:hypothetical protein
MIRRVSLLAVSCALGASIAAALAPPPASAQATIFRECQARQVWTQSPDTFPSPWPAAHPSLTYERARAEAGSGRWDLAAAEVEASFRLLADHAVLAPELRVPMEAQLDSMRRDLVARAGTRQGLRNVGRFASHLTPQGAEFSFGTAAPRLTVTADQPLETIRAICWTAVPANELLGLANRIAEDAVLQGLDRAVAAWDAFNTTGYAQYPWELLLNRPPDGLMPPRVQWIVMHPSVGLELVGTGDPRSMRRVDTILLEPLGVLRYTDDRRFYAGVSFLASLSSSERIGLGPMIHLGQFLKLGYVFRSADDNAESGRDGVVVTADLLQLLAGAPAVYRSAQERVAARLGAAVAAR